VIHALTILRFQFVEYAVSLALTICFRTTNLINTYSKTVYYLFQGVYLGVGGEKGCAGCLEDQVSQFLLERHILVEANEGVDPLHCAFILTQLLQKGNSELMISWGSFILLCLVGIEELPDSWLLFPLRLKLMLFSLLSGILAWSVLEA
jgi:hypothetical protein